MEIEKADRRVRKTKAELTQAMTQLLTQKGLQEISVTELTALADVNRGTFYLHYKDVYDLYSQVENEVFDTMMEMLCKYTNQNLVAMLPQLLEEVFVFIAEHADLCMCLLRTGNASFLQRVLSSLKPVYQKDWHNLFGNLSADLYEYYYAFVEAGCLGTLRAWFYGGMRESPAEMARITAEIMLGLQRGGA